MAGYGFSQVDIGSSQPCITGESPVWDHRIDRLHWVDIRGPAILTLNPETGITTRVPVAETVGFIALTKTPGLVVAGLKSGLHLVDLATAHARPLVTVEADKPGNRINDGTVAADGAILFGTLDCDYAHASGTFWRFGGGRLSPLGGAAIVTNGPAVAGDGRMVLTVDSVNRSVTRHVYDGNTFVESAPFTVLPVGQGIPDGIAFDTEGFAWVAHYGGGRISRFRPDGTIERALTLPAQQITKCAFGGPDLRTLYVTSAAHRRSLAEEPFAGCLFRLSVDVPGLPASICDV